MFNYVNKNTRSIGVISYYLKYLKLNIFNLLVFEL